MNATFSLRLCSVVFVVGGLLCFLGLSSLHAAGLTQSLDLQVGWNAVWLEVEPRDAEGSLMTAGDVFAHAAIDKVAIQSLPVGTAEFSTDPKQLSNQPGWLVWSRDSSLGSGHSDTINIRGNQAYLVHASSPLTLAVSGNVKFFRPRLELGSYNLLGFSVSTNGGPTFQSLLGPGRFRFDSPLVGGSPIKRLDGGANWVDVLQTEQVKAGEADWIYFPLDFPSVDYANPVAVSFAGWQQGGLDFGSAPPSVTVTNPAIPSAAIWLSPAELTFSSLEREGGADRRVTLAKLDSAADFELYSVVRVPDQLAWQTDPSVGVLGSWTLDPLDPAQSRTITLGLYRDWDSEGYYREQLYRIEVQLDGGSAYSSLPVSAVNFEATPLDSSPADGSKFAGLWVGTVTAQAVTGLTETNSPVNVTASRAQLRMLIHVDTNGVPVLLSHVMRMQTKTADPSVLPEEVLILDESQIPYYEGILERGGKRVGIRYETVAFDMPRDNSRGAQSDEFLLTVYDSEGGITDGDVYDYLAGQETRPPSLNEVYHDSWGLSGDFGPGNVIRTGENPLRLDAFHRTNPFRHAYHPQHGAGYSITRSLTIALDGEYQAGSDRLTGTYRETTTGLSTHDLEARGTIVLRRASFVDQLR